MKQLLKSEFERETGFKFNVDSPFSLSVEFQHEETAEDYLFLTKLPFDFHVLKSKKKGQTVYKGCSMEKVQRALSKTATQDFIDHEQCPPKEITTLPVAKVSFQHAQIFVAGRYCKLKRHISNSAWVIKGRRMTEDSIEELIEQFLKPVFKYDCINV